MTKSKTTKRALLFSILSLILCASMLIGSTYAWFTDSVVSGKNKIVAGNLDVELLHGKDANPTAEVKSDTKLFTDVNGEDILWEPGVMVYENFKVENVGTLALKFNMTLNATCNTVDGKSLKDVLTVAILDQPFDGNREKALNELTFGAKIDEFAVKDVPLGANESKEYAIVIYWKPTDHDNDYNLNNGKKADDGTNQLYVDLGVTLVATQNTVEKDSFDASYDAEAFYPATPKLLDTEIKVNITAADGTGETAITDTENKASITVPTGAVTADTAATFSMKLTDSSADSATYEISLKNGENTVELKEPATVTANIGKGLKEVTVKHGNDPMTESDSGADQTYNYNKDTGILTIVTKSFSPFKIDFKCDKNTWLAQNATENVDGTLTDGDKTYVKDDNTFVEVEKDPNTTGLYNGVGADEGKTYAKGNEGVVPVKESEVAGLYEEVVGEGEAAGALFLNCDNSLAEVEEEVPGLYNTVAGDKHYVNDSNAIVEVAPNAEEYGLYQPVEGEAVATDKLYAKASDGVVPVEKTDTKGLYTEEGGDGQFVATPEALDVATGATPADGKPLDINLIQNIDKNINDNDYFGSTKALNLTSDAAVDLSGNNLDIKSNTGKNGICVAEGTSATLSNGTITMNNAYGSSYPVVYANKGEITLDNMTVELAKTTEVCVSAGSGGGKVIIKNTTIKGPDSTYSNAVYTGSGSTLEFENATIIGSIRAENNGNITIKSGDFTQAKFYYGGSGGTRVVYAGIFAANPKTLGLKLADGSTVAQNADGTWTVTAAPSAN